jgi:hypothetical protein
VEDEEEQGREVIMVPEVEEELGTTIMKAKVLQTLKEMMNMRKLWLRKPRN